MLSLSSAGEMNPALFEQVVDRDCEIPDRRHASLMLPLTLFQQCDQVIPFRSLTVFIQCTEIAVLVQGVNLRGLYFCDVVRHRL